MITIDGKESSFFNYM